MSIVKPYTFTAGTKARANEVNANFDTLYSQVNLNISDIATNSNEIDNLENNKAEVNGSSTQRFAVADATSSSDAINKQTLEKAITPLFGYINGLTITKDSGSPNDTIIVDIGSCYDSTNSKVLVLDASVSKQNTNQGANTTYYVYIIGTSTGNTTDILISSTDVEPTLPTGYTLYRLIGNYTTDSDSNISQINSLSGDNKLLSNQIFDRNGYCELSNGLLIQWGWIPHANSGNVQTNTVTFLKPFSSNYTYSPVTSWSASAKVGDKGFWHSVTTQSSTYMVIKHDTSQTQAQAATVWWIAIGY